MENEEAKLAGETPLNSNRFDSRVKKLKTVTPSELMQSFYKEENEDLALRQP